MNLYIFMGTHLPEIACCMETLSRDPLIDGAAGIHWPEGLEPGGLPVIHYDAESVNWVFDVDAPGTAFILLDPRRDLIAQLEHLAGDLRKCLIEPAKILTCVDCRAAGESPALRQWLEAAIYYSDIVLLGNRPDSSKAFVRDFAKAYGKRCYPCHFFLLKGPGQPEQIPEILCGGPRRISQLFDLPDPESSPPGPVIESTFDIDLEEPEEDPYRQAPGDGSGTPPRIPDVGGYIVDNPESPS